MDEFEKWLEGKRDSADKTDDELLRWDRPKDKAPYDYLYRGIWMGFRDALEKYRSMTCKMTSFFVGDGDVRWECSNCRETMKNPDKYCTHCGARIEE